MEIEHGKPRDSRRKKAGPDDPAVSLIAESRQQIKGAIFVPLRRFFGKLVEILKFPSFMTI
jgi:hypothetical protein